MDGINPKNLIGTWEVARNCYQYVEIHVYSTSSILQQQTGLYISIKSKSTGKTTTATTTTTTPTTTITLPSRYNHYVYWSGWWKRLGYYQLPVILNMSSSIINHQSSIIKIHNYIIIHHHHPGPHTLILIIIDSPCSTRPRIPRNNRLALLHAPLLFLRVLRAELRPQLRQVRSPGCRTRCRWRLRGRWAGDPENPVQGEAQGEHRRDG